MGYTSKGKFIPKITKFQMDIFECEDEIKIIPSSKNEAVRTWRMQTKSESRIEYNSNQAKMPSYQASTTLILFDLSKRK